MVKQRGVETPNQWVKHGKAYKILQIHLHANRVSYSASPLSKLIPRHVAVGRFGVLTQNPFIDVFMPLRSQVATHSTPAPASRSV